MAKNAKLVCIYIYTRKVLSDFEYISRPRSIVGGGGAIKIYGHFISAVARVTARRSRGTGHNIRSPPYEDFSAITREIISQVSWPVYPRDF